MTELDKLPPLETENTTPAEPEFKAFSDWKTDNSSGDPIKDRVEWGNYVREKYIDAGSYDDQVELEIRQTTKDRLVAGGLIQEGDTETVDRLYAAPEVDLDTKLKKIQSTFDYDTPEWEAATKYLSFKEVNPEGSEVDESIKQRGEQYRVQAESIADRYYNDAKRRMVLNGEIPIAKIINEKGEQDYIIGSTFDKNNLGESIRNSKVGDVSFADAPNIVSKSRIPKGYNEEAYKVERYVQAMGVIENIWGGLTNSYMDRYGDDLAEADRENRKLTDQQKPDFSSIRRDVNKLLPDNEGFTDEEIEKAFTQSALMRANSKNKFQVYDDPEEAYRNVRSVGFASPLVNPATMANEEKFNLAVNKNPYLSEEQKDYLNTTREPFIQANFEHYDKTLTESDKLSEKWLNALQSGRASGMKDYQILDQFTSDKDNFNEMSARISGVAESVLDGFGELVASIPMLAGADWARDYMIDNIKERNNRRSVARLFGTEFGMGQDFMESIAPMLTDVGATALLSLATAPVAGAGGVAFASAKAGARLTAKGLMKSMTSNVFRQLPTETLEQASKRVIAEGLIKESTKEAGTKGAMAAINAYNSSLVSSIGTTSAVALPAFNRSAGSTYATVYSQLQQDGKLTPEQMHDRALGAGLTSGAITAAITSTFGALGRGSLEDALLGGATKRQIKNIITRLAKVDDIKDEVFTKVVASTMNDTLKKFSGANFAKEIGKNAFDEGSEEALDEFINGFVTDAATDQDTPFLERLEQAGRAAILGGVLGGTVPALKAIKSTVASESTPDQRLSTELQFAKDISDRLAETSPVSAQTVRSILTAPRAGRAAYAAGKLAEARALANPPQVPVQIEEQVTPEGTTVKEEAGADSDESSPVVLTPQGLITAGKEPAVVVVPDEVVSGPKPEEEQQAAKEGQLVDIETETVSPEIPLLENQEEQKVVEPTESATTAFDSTQKADPLIVDLIKKKLASATPEEIKEATKQELIIRPAEEQDVKLPSRATLSPPIDITVEVVDNKEKAKSALNFINYNRELRKDVPNQNSLTIESDDVKKITSKVSLFNSTPDAAARYMFNTVSDLKAAQLEDSNEVGSEEPVVTAPVATTTKKVAGKKQPKAQQPKAEQPKAEQPKAEQPKVEKPKTAVSQVIAEEAEIIMERLANAGALVRFKKSARYGMPLGFDSDTKQSEWSDQLAKRVFSKYKPLKAEEVSEVYQIPLVLTKVGETKSLSWWNPFTESFETNKNIKYRTVIDGGTPIGLFDNNPLTVAAMLKQELPVFVPSTFDGEINEAIKVDEITKQVYDVRFPAASDGLTEISIVHKDGNKRDANPISKTVSNLFEFVSGLKPPIDSTIEVHRDLTNLAETEAKEDGPTSTYYKEVDRVNRFFGDVYTNLGNVADTNKRMVGPSRAFLKLLGFGDPKKGLKRSQVSDANEMAIIEIIPEFHLTLFKGELYQNLEKTNALNIDAGEYTINPQSVQQSRNILLDRIKVPEDFKLPKDLLDRSPTEIKAYFLLKKGFKKGQTIPKIEDQNVTAENLNTDSANVVFDQFIYNSINDNLSRPDENGLFPNVPAVIKRISNRVIERVKYKTQTAQNSDIFSRLQYEDDGTILDSKEFYDALAEMYGIEEVTYENIHSSLDALKAGEVFREIRSDLENLLRSNEGVGASKSLRDLAKKTVFRSDPSVVENMFPVDVFRSIAHWASTNKQTTADSFRFRRQLLDHFPVANEQSKRVHDAFEASGAFAYRFKRVADKGTINMLIRNGMTEQEANFVLEQRNLKRIVEKTGATEQEADSILRSQRAAQSNYSAPSFINEKHRQFYRGINEAEINRLGIESGNSESVINALKKISKESSNEQNKAVALLLLRFQSALRNVRFVITDIPSNRAGSFYRGMDGANMVMVNKAGYYGNGVESVILHEYLHAVTVDVLTRPESSLTPAQRSAKTRLRGLMQLANKSYTSYRNKNGVGLVEFEAAMVNLEEFVATFFSSPDFQKQLKMLRQTEKEGRNFFIRIYDAILDIFGIKPKSDIDKAFSDLVDLASVANIDGYRTLESQIDRSIAEARNNGASRRIVPVNRVETDREIESRLSSFEGFDSLDEATPEHQEAIDILINQAVRSLVPANVEVTIFDTQKEADDNGIFGDRPEAAITAVLMKDSTGRSIPSIFVNRANMRSALLSRNSVIDNPTSAKGMLEAIFDEELTHIAEFYALSTEEVDAVASTMSDTDFDEIVDKYTSIPERRDQLKNALRGENGVAIKNQLVGEMLRMHSQKITRGYTSEEDIAFFESNPSIMSIAFRYIRGVFRRMYARYNLNKNNPELAAAIHRMSAELRFLQEGTYNLDTHASFDPNNPENNIEILRQRFAATSADITEETSDDDIMKRFKGLFDSLELPVALYKGGNYQHMSTKWQQWVKGDVDPRISRLHKQQKFFEQATDALGKSMMSRISKLIEQTYGKTGIDPSILSAATGTTEFIRIDKDLKKTYRLEWIDAVKKRKDAVKNGEIDPKWTSDEALAAMRKAMLTDKIAAETDRLRSEIRAKQADALQKISQDSPQLAAALVEMRKVTDAMSKTIKDKYNLSESMQVKFDNNMGIYLTRSYRAFNEEGYIEKVLTSTDKKFVDIRQEASEYFRDTYIKRSANSKLRLSVANGKVTGNLPITKEKAIELATDEVDNNPAIVAQFMAQFLRSYSPDYRSRAGSLPKGVTKSLIDNLRRKSNLDPKVRKLLGEYDQDTEGVNNLLRTYSLVTTMVARQSFYNNLIAMGQMRPVIGPDNNPVLDEDGEPMMEGFLLSEDDLREKLKKNPMMQQEYVNIRTGKIYTPDTKGEIPSGLAGEYDPTYNYYGPKEMVEGMRRMYTPPVIDENLTGAQRATSGVVNIFSGLTGLSLGVKTLGSLPFYLRNIASNMFFFAPAQGFLRFDKMFKEIKLVKEKFKDPYQIDAYQAELISLGVLNNEMASSLVKDILNNSFKLETIEGEIDTIMGKIKNAANKGSEFIKPLTDRLQALSGAVDGFYKMAYFEHELNKLIAAKESDITSGNKDSFFARLSENELKREAARKVLATAQSYSESPPIVQEAVKSVGMFIAPFLRFKTEAPRIVINTYKEAMAEIKSGNPVMVERGYKRFIGMSSVLFVWSAAVPTAIRLLLGIGEDEDEALRATVPEYMKDNTFFFVPWFGKELKSIDLTFLNPFSMLADPVLRAGEHIFRGDPEQSFVSFTNAFMNQYLDQQIFTGAISDVIANKDSSTGQQIHYKSDGAMVFVKSLAYVIEKSFLPRTVQKGWETINSARGTAVDPQFDPLNILLGEFAPTKIHDVDVKAQLNKLLTSKRDELTTFSAHKNKLKTKRALSDGEIRGLAREFVESRVRINEELYRGLRGFSNLPQIGLSERDIVTQMREKSVGMGDRRIMLLQNKMVEKPVLDPSFIKQVAELEGGIGIKRLEVFQAEIDRIAPARFIPLNP